MNFKLLFLTFTLGVIAAEPQPSSSSQLAEPDPTITFTDSNGTSHTLTSRDWESNYAAIEAESKLQARFKTGGFLDKCKNVRYYLAKVDDKNPRKNGYTQGYKKSPWLVAECPDKNGNYLCTWLELGECLVNLDGELYQGKKGDGRWFNCGCWTKYPKGTIKWEDIKERMKRTTIDLNVAIGAQDGYLYCHGNWGIKDFCSGRPSNDPFSMNCKERGAQAYCWQ
ncbi:hypothetical protein FLONG3_7997 [Fusarium longipes]|uniref:Cyanovirin-N domain-containing protein n=1 Tax=Fusarium longipes TaxID=694270 RepID=A0A395S933_9HYPO|nr:hypothetical protein FLONG3_7997 [Fusarium longipes]